MRFFNQWDDNQESEKEEEYVSLLSDLENTDL